MTAQSPSAVRIQRHEHSQCAVGLVIPVREDLELVALPSRTDYVFRPLMVKESVAQFTMALLANGFVQLCEESIRFCAVIEYQPITGGSTL